VAAGLEGFGIRLKPSRIASIQYRTHAGRTRKLAIGRVGTLAPEEARVRARELLAAVAKGGRRPPALPHSCTIIASGHTNNFSR
jgi:hypothetical protein